MKKILIFLFLFPTLAICQDTVIIYKTYDDDTLWNVKKIYKNQNVDIKSFKDSTDIYYYILNDIVDEARKTTDSYVYYENRNKFLNALHKLDKAMINGNITGAFDYLSNQFSHHWLGKYQAMVNGVRVIAGAEIFVNKNNELRIKIGESIHKSFIAIGDTYGIIPNYPNAGEKLVVYKIGQKNYEDVDFKLVLKKIKQ